MKRQDLKKLMEIKLEHSRAYRDLAIIFIVAFLTYLLAHFFNLFEVFTDFASEYRGYRVDKIITVFVILAIAFMIFSLRRIGELEHEVIIRKEVEKELEKLATTDSLTQAYNRTKFEEIIEREMERSRRFYHPLSISMFDIDNFKKVNDTFGHSTGDYVLKTIADIVRKYMRKINLFIRWGGEEFMIIIIETNHEGAKVFSEILRKAIENYNFDKAGRITVSFGVAQFKIDDTADTFVKRADDALYQAKIKGKNRVEVNT